MFRLGTFLFYRMLKVGKDDRFDRMRNSPGRLFITWMIQGEKRAGASLIKIRISIL